MRHPDTVAFSTALGSAIRARRGQGTLQQIADPAGLYSSSLWRIERGHQNAYVGSLMRIAQALANEGEDAILVAGQLLRAATAVVWPEMQLQPPPQ